MKQQIISDILENLQIAQEAQALVQQKIWNLRHTENFERHEDEALGHMISHLEASSRQLTSFRLAMESYR
ncbi:MAG: hypothetical protein V2B18_21255 [Pseudomonadota bacterium]